MTKGQAMGLDEVQLQMRLERLDIELTAATHRIADLVQALTVVRGEIAARKRGTK